MTHRIRVVATGTFDGIHPGHKSYLRQAKALGSELAVIVARDQTVLARKGTLPRRSEGERLAAIQAVRVVDRAVLGSASSDYLAPIEALRPDVIALGYDQWPSESTLSAELATRGLTDCRLVRLKSFEPERYHSSILK